MWPMPAVLDSAGLNVLPASYFLPPLSSFFPLGGSCTAMYLLLACVSLPSQFCCRLPCPWRFLLGSGLASSGKCFMLSLSLPPSPFFPFPSAPLFMLIRSHELPLTKARRLRGWGGVGGEWRVPRRRGLHRPLKGSKGPEGSVFRCFLRTTSFFSSPRNRL